MPNWCAGTLRVRGKILKDEELHFEDYQWDCICPNMGG